MYGGTCINVACVPTKDLVVSAEARRPADDPQEWCTASVAGLAVVGAGYVGLELAPYEG